MLVLCVMFLKNHIKDVFFLIPERHLNMEAVGNMWRGITEFLFFVPWDSGRFSYIKWHWWKNLSFFYLASFFYVSQFMNVPFSGWVAELRLQRWCNHHLAKWPTELLSIMGEEWWLNMELLFTLLLLLLPNMNCVFNKWFRISYL